MDNTSSRYSAEQILRFIREKKEDFWNRERERRPLRLFHEAAKRVPAYKDFLKKNKVNPDKIKTFRDFQLVPPISKKNYLRQYPLEKLCWDGSLKKPLVWTSPSGSTGEPFYFPRGHALDWEYSILAELFLNNGSLGNQGPTLVIICLGMGVWIGGLITYQAFEIAARRTGQPVSIITPGINKTEIFNALRDLSPNFKKTILVGYPPFLKDVIDEAPGEGINLKRLHIRILTAAEAYTEKFRDYLAEKAGIKNVCLDMLNIYGTADIGAMAWETPTTILMRRFAIQNKKLFKEIFSPIEKMPTLAQYNPLFITFEAVNEEIILSGNNMIPLIRYAVGDHGGVFGFNDGIAKLKKFNIDFEKKAEQNGLSGNIYELPFVYVYERHDFSIKLYGAIIYTEPIREALLHKKISRFITGKFTMLIRFDKRYNQFMEVNIEFRSKVKPKLYLKKLVTDLIVKHLMERSSEYQNNYSLIPRKVTPKVVFWKYEHPLHFKLGIKQKWVKGND